MIICLKTRLGEIHIINWSAPHGTHYTLCGKAFTNKQNIETFSADNLFPDMCRNCYTTQEYYNDSTATDARDWATDHVVENTLGEYLGVQKGWDNTKSKYADLVESRYWPKAKRMRRKFPTRDTKKGRRRHGLIAKFSSITKRK
jgi:hypothetical protein